MQRLFIITLVLSFHINLFAQTGDRNAYIRDFREIAISEMDRSGIPASIKLAQGILESNAGISTLATKANNHFGIKCGGRWDGPTYYHKDDDYDKNGNLIKSCFRKYDSADKSYQAHTVFLQSNQRYAFLFDYSNTDYKNWAKGLKKAGYATNPKYPDLLINLIERYELHKFDKMTSEILVFEDEDEEIDKPSRPSRPSSSTIRKQGVKNGVKMVIAKNGDTHSKIASAYNIGIKRLLKYNDLPRSEALANGAYVYLQPKRKKNRGSQTTHRVKAEDNMYSISQKYGIRLECLYKRNLMTLGTQPAVGERIYLKKKAKKAPKTARPDSSVKPPKPPVTKPPSTTKPDKPTPPKPQATTIIYVVKKGDTLWAVSKEYGMTVDEIKALNNLTSNVLSVGQELKVKKK